MEEGGSPSRVRSRSPCGSQRGSPSPIREMIFSESASESEATGGLSRGATRGNSSSECDPIFGRPRPEGKANAEERGAEIPQRGNYYRLKTLPSWRLYQYRVDFEPEVDRTRVKKILFQKVAENLNIAYMFDGTKLFSSKHLKTGSGQPIADEEVLGYTVEGIKNRDQEKEEKYEVLVKIKFVKALEAGSPDYCQLCSWIIQRHLFGMGLELFGRSFFDMKAVIKLPQQRLELWPGYVMHMKTHLDEAQLCVKGVYKVVCQDSMLELIRQIETKKNCENDKAAVVSAVNAELKDTIVMTMHNRRFYHVEDVDFNLSPRSTFEGKDGLISYADYYKMRYGLEIKDLNQPLLLSKLLNADIHRLDDKPVFLIPELCQSTGITDDMKADFRLVKSLNKYLPQGDIDRLMDVEYFMKRLIRNDVIQKELQDWGIMFESSLSHLIDFMMPSEAMVFANGATQPVDDKGDFRMAFRSKQKMLPANLQKWAVLVPQTDAARVDNLIRSMAKAAVPLGIKLSYPLEVVVITETRFQSYLRALDELLRNYSDLQMLFVILPNNKLDLFASVKSHLDLSTGVASQCFLAKDMAVKRLKLIVTKVIVEMKAKLGGERWTIKLPLRTTMIVGVDVYSGAKGSKAGSIGAMVATFSPHFTKNFSTTFTYHSNDDLSKNMRTHISKCLEAFPKEKFSELPGHIIIYRDGVEESELKYVYEVELCEIQKELADRYKSSGWKKPQLTYVVVNKQINPRVFMAKQQQAFENPPPGSVVDTVRKSFDFHLLSCGPRQGTAIPCLYNVLLNDSNYEPDQIQQITDKLCIPNSNWTGKITVPVLCGYASILAFHTGNPYTGPAHRNLSKRPHFISFSTLVKFLTFSVGAAFMFRFFPRRFPFLNFVFRKV